MLLLLLYYVCVDLLKIRQAKYHHHITQPWCLTLGFMSFHLVNLFKTQNPFMRHDRHHIFMQLTYFYAYHACDLLPLVPRLFYHEKP